MSKWADRSWNAFPGGSLGEYNLPEGLSIVLTHGQGSKVYDTLGREYIDLTMGWGSVMLGHAYTGIAEAVKKQVDLGSNFAYVSQPALELAETMIEAIPCAEKVRFCASGTEATMYAVRFARAFTGRSKIIKFEGAYHGANEIGTMSLFPKQSFDFPQAEPTSAGFLKAVHENTLIVPFNDLETTARIIRENAPDVAAVIVEPLHRCTTPEPGFLEGLRRVTQENDILLIFDEVVTGFRLAYGGAQEYYGVTPDLAAYGKGLGGGFPIGAIAGRADILDLCAEAELGQDRYVWFASSVGGNPITATAALVTLKEMRQPDIYQRFFAIGQKLRQGLRTILEDLSLKAQVLGDGPLCAVSFTDRPVVDYRTASQADGVKARRFTLGLFANGIFLNPMSTKLYVSLAHSDKDIARIHDAAFEVLKGIGD
ncbi:aspartate aminotransferase family protein [Chloroflexi bacterium TSY]|nr:aspartate aminotransferase family protein [Chloroflexi bacterium TSY]